MTITIISFSLGTTIKSADVNANFSQIANALDGVDGNSFVFVSPSNSTVALSTQLPLAPGADQDVLRAMVSGDSVGRISFYVRSSDNYGGIRGGTGASYAQTFFCTSGGWQSSGGITATTFVATTTQSFGGGNYSYIASSGSGAVYFENGGVKTNGSGRIISSQWQPSVSSVAFAKLGYYTGTSSATVAHGAGTTPSWVCAIDNSTGGQMTIGAQISGASNTIVSAGASHTWAGIAL